MAKSTQSKNNAPTGKAIPTPESLPHRKVSSTKQSNLIAGLNPPASASPEEKGMLESEENKTKQQVTEEDKQDQ